MPKIEDFNSLIVEVDSKKNIMFLKGEEDKKLTNIKSYKVSTARTNIKKPLGIGDITAISLEPIWYPTQKTLKAFRERQKILWKRAKTGQKKQKIESLKNQEKTRLKIYLMSPIFLKYLMII